MNWQEIEDENDPRLTPFKNLKKPSSSTSTFVAENEKVVQRLLVSDLEVISLLGTQEALERNESLIQKKGGALDSIFRMKPQDIEKLVGFSIHRGFLGLGKIPDPPNINDWDKQIIGLNRIYDSENIGSILRTAKGFGIDTILYDRETSHPYLRRSVRVSMGNIFSMKIAGIHSIEETIRELKRKNYHIIGTTSSDFKSTYHSKKLNSIYEFDFPESWLLILGNEAEGIDESILKSCDSWIHIPMKEGVDSFNVSHSLAVILGIHELKKIKAGR